MLIPNPSRRHMCFVVAVTAHRNSDTLNSSGCVWINSRHVTFSSILGTFFSLFLVVTKKRVTASPHPRGLGSMTPIGDAHKQHSKDVLSRIDFNAQRCNGLTGQCDSVCGSVNSARRNEAMRL